jgi:hypothetical protein
MDTHCYRSDNVGNSYPASVQRSRVKDGSQNLVRTEELLQKAGGEHCTSTVAPSEEFRRRTPFHGHSRAKHIRCPGFCIKFEWLMRQLDCLELEAYGCVGCKEEA